MDIILDERLLETRDIRFMAVKDANGSETLQPCLSIRQLKAWGVKTALFPQLDAGQGECADLKAIPQASADFQFGAQRLAISIPQAAIDLPARGYVPPEMWDEGITAAMLNYSLSGANSRARSGQAPAATVSMQTCDRGSTSVPGGYATTPRSRDASGGISGTMSIP